ncbi:MAG TPA: oligoendopeptidase F [Thermomicrobiales bacterium]|nr:oligoendopeptidase F [Thermomicrobiales bacterium]
MATAMNEIPTRDQIKVEDTWDLRTIFVSDEGWEQEAQEIPGLVEVAASYEGRLGEGPAVVAEALKAINLLEERLSMLLVYASLRRDEDTTDTEANARYEQAIALAIGASQALAFVQPELLALPREEFAQLASAEELSTYRHMFDNLDRQRAHVRSQEVEEVLAQMGEVTRTASEAFNALDNADLEYGEVADEQGNTIALTKGRYGLLQESQDRDVRRESHDRMIEAYQRHEHTISSLYGASVRKDVTSARIRGYDSARREALFDDNVPDSVYDTLIEVVRQSGPILERYLDLRRQALGVDRLEVYDLRVPLAPESTKHYDFRDAVEIVLRGVQALGEEYVRDLRSGFESRWVDVHETKGKRSGAYSWGAYGAPPVMLMNWNGTLSDVFTLAHEAGHAMHSFYSNRAQPFHLASYPIFLAEIASTVNEVLLTWDLLGSDEARDPVQRFALLNRFADSFYGTVFRQAMFAEFEQRTHAMVEAGTPLTLDALNQLYGELHEAYLPGVNVDDKVRVHWSRVPHFYRAFYVYQYATGMSSAINIATAVRDEGTPAQQRYLEMLEAGGSDYPMNILKRAGVDLTQREPLETAASEFERVVAEMERLAQDGVLTRAAEQAARQTA